MSSDLVRLSLPDRILAEIGRTTSIRVRVTELGGIDRKLSVRALGNLGGPLPATEVDLAAGTSVRTEIVVSIPHGMPPGEHQYLFEVLDRDNGRVLESVDATVDIQHTRSVSMSVQPQSIRKRMRGKVRVVIRNHDDEPHKIRLRAEGDEPDTRISLERPGVIVRPGEMVRVPARVKVKPYYIGKQKERFYSIVGEGAGVPVYARGNVRQKPMIGKNVKSLGLLGSIIIVWLTLTISVIRLISPATQEAAVGAETGTEQPGAGGETPVSPLVPVLVDVNGTVTAVPDGTGVVVSWRPVSIGDVPSTTGKVAGGSAAASPDVASQTTTTDADGKFVVAGLDGSGLYEFSFAKAGHQTQTKIVQPNGQPVTLEIALVAGSGTIGGTAVDESGRPLGGVDITLTDGAITYGTSTPTDGDSAGRFSFNNLSSPGTYVLDAKITGRGLASATIELQTGQAVTDIRLILSRDVTTLSGRIGSAAFESGVAAQSATPATPSANLAARLPTFTVTATDGTLTRSTTTLSEGLLAGTFRLEQLPVNRTYTVTYEAPGFLSYTEQIELRADTPERQVSMVRSTGRLRGTVKVEGTNLSPTAVAVTVTNPDFTYKATDAISSNGSLLIDGIEPGRYVVLFEALGLVTQTREVVIGAGTSSTLDVTLSAVKSTSKASSLSFKVTKEGDATDATPVTATLMYRLSTDCGTGGEANNCAYTVGNDGSLTVAGLEAGGYVIRFRATGYADKFVSAQVAPQTAAPQLPVSITPLGTLQGMVADDTAAPLQGIQVGLYADTQPPSNTPIATVTTNANGEFSFVKKLEAKNYKVRVTSTSFVGTDRSVTGALSATLNLDLVVRGLATITGEVQEFDLNIGDTQSIAPARFAVFLRQGNDDTTDLWQDAVNLGLGKSIGGFRLGVANNFDAQQVRTGPNYDICVILVSGTDTLASLQTYIDAQSLANHPCNVNNSPYRRSTSNEITLAPTEIATRSAYFSPDPGRLTGRVTVTGAAVKGLRVEARRVDKSDRIIESVSTTTDETGLFSFTRLTPVRPASAFVPSGAGDALALTDYDDHDGCDRENGACWLIRAFAENTGYTDSDYLTIYPNSNITVPDRNIVQAQASSLSLTIRDVLGNAVTTATVKVNNTTQCSGTPGGKCVVANPTVGSEAAIEVSATGFRTVTTSIGIGAGTTAATITLVPTSNVVVTVRDTSGAVLAGAAASLVDSTGSQIECTGTTNGSGQCTIPGSARGPAIVSASKNGVGAITTFTSVTTDPSAVTARLVADAANVTGEITQSSDGSPIAGATVRLVQVGGPQIFSTTTSTTGQLFVGNVPSGNWTVEVSAPGYSSRSGITITVPSGAYTIPSNLVRLDLDSAILVGVVTSGGSPVAGATVSLTSGTDIRSAVTNAAGEYRFSTLSPSVWTLAVQSAGFGSFSAVVDGDGAVPGDQPLPIGLTTRNVALTALTGSLTVTIRDTLETSITTATVKVNATTKCNGNTPGGKCSITGLEVGSDVTIEVSAVGFRSATTTIGIGSGIAATTIVLVPTSNVAVTVRDPFGETVAGATVSLVDSSGFQMQCAAVTDATGQCTISGSARGPAVLSASKNGVGAITSAVSVLASPSVFTVRLQPDTSNVSGLLTRSSDGSGVGAATVRLVQVGGDQVFSTTTAAASGRFFFGNVPTGDWTIEVSAPGVATRTGIAVTIPSGSYTVPSNLIQVSSDLVILTGIVSSGGSAVAGATVSLTSGTDIRSAVTNAAGEYRFSDLTPSLWTLSVQSLGHVSFSAVVDGDPVAAGNQALVVGVTSKNVSLTALPGVLEVYTRTSSGNPINNIRVRVYASEAAFNADPATTLADVTSANGIAKAENLTAGQHWVVVTDATGVYASQSFVVNIDRGFTTQLPVYLGSTRAVVVIGLAGIPAAGFGPQTALDLKVRLVDTTDNSKIVGPVRTAINFDRGVATLVDVPIGTYSLQIDHDQPGTFNAFTPRADIVHAGTTYSVPAKTLSISAPGTRDEGLLLLHTKPAGLVVQAATDCADFNATKVNSFTAVLRDGYLLSPTAPTASNLGAASFTSIAPGTYAVELVSAGHLNRSVSLSVNDVSVSATTTHCVQMTPSAAVEVVPLQVTVRDSANALLAGAVATASPGGASCRTSADGTCTILTKPDSYSVSVAHDAHSTTSGGPVNVSSAAGGSVSVVMSTLSASIEFEAKTSAGATINAFAVDSVTDSKDCSATNGSCTVSAIADTNVRGFRISATGYEPTFVSTRVSGSSNKVVVVLEAIPATPSSDDRLLVHAFDPTNGTAITTFTVKNTVNDNVICSASGVSSCSSATPIPIGSISLKVEATGYEAGYGSSTITAESGSRLYIALYPKPTLQIRVRSSDANGPLAGVTVALSPAATNCAGGATDSEGVCNASGLAVGTTTITLSASHYFTTTAIVSISRGAASIDVTMRPKGSLTVTLKPQPAANTTVSIAGTALTCSVAGSATPAASADCTINDVPTGTWIVTAPGHKSATATVARGTTTTVELVP